MMESNPKTHSYGLDHRSNVLSLRHALRALTIPRSSFSSLCLRASVVRFASYFPRQDARKMYYSRTIFAAAQDSLYVHQATGINGCYVLGPGDGDAIAL